MALIHPTAIIDTKAEIGDGVEIGPYAIVGPNVKIGARTKVGAHSVLEGHTTIGVENKIGHFASVGGAPQDMKYRNEPTQLVIGDRNMIREFTTLHTGTVQDTGITRIGNDNWIMAYVHIAHDCVIGNNTIFSNNAQIAGHVHVEDWAILGGMCGVHQFVRIGAHAMVGGASRLVQDVPPFVIAAGDPVEPHGINSEGLKRRGFSLESIAELRQAYKILYKQNLSFENAKAALLDFAKEKESEPDCAEKIKIFHDFIAASQRGIVR
jgi:UDP-N-acetylglucosamine acyltransferase